MFRIMWLLKRKPGVGFEHFRDHYETTHSALGKKYFGHLMLGYRRNYDRAKEAGSAAGIHGMASDYDCVAEWDLRDEAAFAEFMEILADPVIGKIFRDDEASFLDSAATRLMVCDCRDTGTSIG
jgi:hypothetical protein